MKKARGTPRACLFGRRCPASELVAKRALDLALQILGFALAFLHFAFGAQTVIVRRLADGLLGVADGFVGEALGFVLECTHGKSPWLARGSIASPPINERHSANVPWKRDKPFTAKRKDRKSTRLNSSP